MDKVYAHGVAVQAKGKDHAALGRPARRTLGRRIIAAAAARFGGRPKSASFTGGRWRVDVDYGEFGGLREFVAFPEGPCIRFADLEQS